MRRRILDGLVTSPVTIEPILEGSPLYERVTTTMCGSCRESTRAFACGSTQKCPNPTTQSSVYRETVTLIQLHTLPTAQILLVAIQSVPVCKRCEYALAHRAMGNVRGAKAHTRIYIYTTYAHMHTRTGVDSLCILARIVDFPPCAARRRTSEFP